MNLVTIKGGVDEERDMGISGTKTTLLVSLRVGQDQTLSCILCRLCILSKRTSI